MGITHRQALSGYDEAKTAEMILHIARETEQDPTAGATKLNQIPYYAELSHLRRYGKTITGAEYRKQEQGPTLRRMLPIVAELERTGAAKLVERDYFGNRQRRLIALRDPDLSRFTAAEVASIDQIIRQTWGESAHDISIRSHDDAGWRAAEYGETISFALAFVREDADLDDHIRRHALKLTEDARPGS